MQNEQCHLADTSPPQGRRGAIQCPQQDGAPACRWHPGPAGRWPGIRVSPGKLAIGRVRVRSEGAAGGCDGQDRCADAGGAAGGPGVRRRAGTALGRTAADRPDTRAGARPACRGLRGHPRDLPAVQLGLRPLLPLPRRQPGPGRRAAHPRRGRGADEAAARAPRAAGARPAHRRGGDPAGPGRPRRRAADHAELRAGADEHVAWRCRLRLPGAAGAGRPAQAAPGLVRRSFRFADVRPPRHPPAGRRGVAEPVPGAVRGHVRAAAPRAQGAVFPGAQHDRHPGQRGPGRWRGAGLPGHGVRDVLVPAGRVRGRRPPLARALPRHHR